MRVSRDAYSHKVLENTERRNDGFINVLNSFNTMKDNSTAYTYEPEALVTDDELTRQYEIGLFAKIIDTPAEEAVKNGFDLGIKSPELEEYISDKLDELDFETNVCQAIKWARLYGGSIIVLVADDGKGLEEPLDIENCKNVCEMVVYERAVVEPDYTCLYTTDVPSPWNKSRTKFGQPQFYRVMSQGGQFTVHESRCLVFKNGILPERTNQTLYKFWGIPEYTRIRNELREAITSHSYGVKMLERSVQPIYSQKGLAETLSTEGGDEMVLKRLMTIDMARGILNSIAIDSEGESYSFASFPYTGVTSIIDTTCNMLSAVTNIPQTILFGRSPAGMNATGQGDLENYYNFVERNIQKPMLKNNYTKLIDLILQVGMNRGDVDEIPKIKLTFNPLWSMSETEQIQLDQQKASIASTRAATAKQYIDMGVIDPSEVRAKLAAEDQFDIETMLDDYTEEELWENAPEPPEEESPEGDMPMMGQADDSDTAQIVADIKRRYEQRHKGDYGAGAVDPKVTAKKEKNRNAVANIVNAIRERLEKRRAARAEGHEDEDEYPFEEVLGEPKPDQEPGYKVENKVTDFGSVGVLVIKNGYVLCGIREDNGLVCGAGGHIEQGEIPIMAAIRETAEEFGIQPTGLTPIGKLTGLDPKYGEPEIFVCTEYSGKPKCKSFEMDNPFWLRLGSKQAEAAMQVAFKPFAKSLEMLENLDISSIYSLTKDAHSDRITIPQNTHEEEVFNADKIHANYPDDAVEWRTINGTPVPFSIPFGLKDGIPLTEIGKKIEKETSGGKEMQSKFVTARSDLKQNGNNNIMPFTENALDNHWVGGDSDHSRDFPGMTKWQYADRAQELASQPVDGVNILGYKATNCRGRHSEKNGSIVRYDTRTREWVRGYETGPASLFIPDPERYPGHTYFEMLKRIETGGS